MGTTVVLKDEPTRKVILAALWECLDDADGAIGCNGLYDLVFEGIRPEATDAAYRAACDRFDALLTFLTDAREDIRRVETAELGTAVMLGVITKEGLAKELDSYRKWIEDTKEGFWSGDGQQRQDILDRHDAVRALLAGFADLAVA